MRVLLGYAALIMASVAGAAACTGSLGRQYEYEEQLYLGLNGSATVIVNASIPALVSLHGLPLDPSMRSPVDRDQVRRLFATAGCQDVRVGQPWIRRGRRFIQVRVSAEHVAELNNCGPLSWSSYAFGPAADGQALGYRQVVGEPTANDPGDVNWNGSEIVAFKLHLPSRIVYHNVRRLEDGEPGEPDRGNILTWEQPLSDRRAGQPVEIDVRMDAESILSRTLWLFGGAFVAALLVLATLIWLTVRRGRRRQQLPA
jgi:hypothetical protein